MSAPCQSPFSWPVGWAGQTPPVSTCRFCLSVLRWPSRPFSERPPGCQCRPGSMGTKRPLQIQDVASQIVGTDLGTRAYPESEMTW